MTNRLAAVILAAATLLVAPVTWAQSDESVAISIEQSQPLSDALQSFADQTDLQVIFFADITEGKVSRGLDGEYPVDTALDTLLADTGLSYTFIDDTAVSVQVAAADPGGDSDSKNSSPTPQLLAHLASDAETERAQGTSGGNGESDERERAEDIPEVAGFDVIVVTGSRNVAIGRTEDDIQPFVVFGADEIQQSGATDLDEFLRDRLPSNVSFGPRRQGGTENTSLVNLRGLGADQTLILVNGRRLPSVTRASAFGAEFSQSDINGIPVSAIERVEVLPTTASGIYGGGATGGVINIVLRSDYAESEFSVNYDNTFDADSAVLRVDGSTGFSLEGGRTDVLITASYQTADELLARDRDFARDSRRLALQNAPEQLLEGFTPPAGRTANIKGFAPLVLKDGTELGSSITFVPDGYAGAASDGGAALVANAGQFNLDLPDDYGSLGGLRTLSGGPTTQYYSLNVQREFTERLSIYSDVSYRSNELVAYTNPDGFPSVTVLPESSPTNPFAQPILVSVPSNGLAKETRTESDTLSVSSGFIADVSPSWAVAGDITWSRHKLLDIESGDSLSSTLATGVADGRIDVLSDFASNPPDYAPFLDDIERTGQENTTDFLNYSLRASGSAFAVPAGEASLSLLFERREQEFDDAEVFSTNNTTGTRIGFAFPGASEEVNSVFGEILVPIVGRSNNRPGINALDFVFSARYDDYEYDNVASGDDNFVLFDFAAGVFPEVERRRTSFDGSGITAGFKYTPVDGIDVRASYATGFLPPSLGQVRPRLLENQSLVLTDPQRGNAPMLIGPFDRLVGGNPDITPEDSESYTVGFIVQPSLLEGFRFSVDYVRIEKSDEIGLLSFEDLFRFFPERIVRGPLEPDAPSEFTAGPILSIDGTVVNISSTLVEAIDYQLSYELATARFGDFSFYAIASNQRKFERQVTAEDEPGDTVGFRGGPVAWRGNAGLDWQRDQWRAGWNVEYYDSFSVLTQSQAAALRDLPETDRSYQNAQAELQLQGRAKVSAQTFHDAYVSYTVPSGNTDLRLGVRNVFNESELRADVFGSAAFFAPVDVRLRSYSLTVRQRF